MMGGGAACQAAPVLLFVAGKKIHFACLSFCLFAIFFRDHSRYEPFNDWGGGRGCNNFVPVLGGNGTKIAPTGGIFDQPPGLMR